MTPEILTAIQGIILAVLSGLAAIIAVAIPFAIKYFKEWMNAKTHKLRGDDIRAKVEFALIRLDRIVDNVVKEIEQGKETNDMPLTKEKADGLILLAFSRVKQQVTQEIIDNVSTIVKDPDRYIMTKLEATVWKTKLAKISADCK